MRREGSETISQESTCPPQTDREAPYSLLLYGDDIVHPFRKLLDKCNQLVRGSSPLRGAKLQKSLIKALLCYNIGSNIHYSTLDIEIPIEKKA